MRQVNPDLIYLLDREFAPSLGRSLPAVMGDVGRGLYVSKDVVPIYTSMLALASIITPNQFETEYVFIMCSRLTDRLLAGVRIRSLSTLHLALSRLHTDHSLPHITLSSLPLPVSLIQRLELPAPPSSYTSLLPEPAPPWYDAVGKGNPSDEVLVCFASSYTNGKLDTWAFALPTIRGYFSGVGDLFSAMTLAHFDGARTDHNLPPLPYAVSKALLTVQQILLRTHVFSLVQSGAQDNSQTLPANDPAFVNQSVLPSDSELDSLPPEALNGVKRKARRMRLRELRLIAERDLIVNGGEGWPGQRLQWESILDMGI